VTGDVEVNDGASMVAENQEADQDAEVHGRNREEVDRRDLPGMVVQEGAPSLRRWLAATNHVLGHRDLPDLVPEQMELRADPASSPGGIVAGHATDEDTNLRVELRPAASAP
jgi:hypothetical protein